MRNIDDLDARILLMRDELPDATVIELAGRLGVARNTVHARSQRLRREGVLRPPSSQLSPTAVGRPLLAFVTLSVAQQDIDSIYSSIRRIPEVLEAQTTTGDADLMLRVVARDTEDLHRVTQLIQLIEGVNRSSTSVATTEVIAYRLAPLLRRL